MKSDVTFETGEYGRRAVLHSDWSGRLLALLLTKDVAELELNQGKGWRGSDIAFLRNLPNLRAFEIFDFNIRDISPIHSLHNLRRLGITTYCSTRIDFGAFTKLESCALEWRPGASSLFECLTLRDLFINRYKGRDVTPFTKLVDLQSLAILNAPVATLQGLSVLTKLRRLRLANLRKLTSLAGIEGLANLEELDINTCRSIGSIEEVGSLTHLKRLEINNDGPIRSLKPILKLHGLDSVGFYESTDILDGDLSPLLLQPRLSRLSFQNRKHYSHRREDFSSYSERSLNVKV